MTDITIVTAIYDTYDTLKPVLPQDGADVDWVLVTDTQPPDPLGWRVIIDPKPDTPPVRAAKAPKFEPWKYTDAPASIWVDASFKVTSPRFAAEAIAHADPIAQFVHPWRDCIHTEAAEVTRLGLDPDGVATWQADRYRQAGHPDNWGLWATGIIARRHTAPVKRMGATWAREVETGSARDQVAQPYVLRKARLRPTALPGNHMENAWVAYRGSDRHR